MTNLESEIVEQREIKKLESHRNYKRRNLFEIQDEIERNKASLLAEIEERLKQ